MCDERDKCDNCGHKIIAIDVRCHEDERIFCSLDCFAKHERDEEARRVDEVYEQARQAEMR